VFCLFFVLFTTPAKRGGKDDKGSQLNRGAQCPESTGILRRQEDVGTARTPNRVRVGHTERGLHHNGNGGDMCWGDFGVCCRRGDLGWRDDKPTVCAWGFRSRFASGLFSCIAGQRVDKNVRLGPIWCLVKKKISVLSEAS